MSQLDDVIYDVIIALIKDPTEFMDRNFIMSIFDRWLNKSPAQSGKFECSYIPKFTDWWVWMYVQGRKTRYIENNNTKVFVVEEVSQLCFDPEDEAIKETTDVVYTFASKGNCQWSNKIICVK